MAVRVEKVFSLLRFGAKENFFLFPLTIAGTFAIPPGPK